MSVSCGLKHTVVLTEKGEVYAWGANNLGQIGMPADWVPPAEATSARKGGGGAKGGKGATKKQKPTYEEVSKIVRGMLPIEPRPLSQLLRTYDRETNASEPLRASPTLKLVPQSHTSRTVLFRAPADT